MVHINKNNKAYAKSSKLSPEIFKKIYGVDNEFDLLFLDKYKA